MTSPLGLACDCSMGALQDTGGRAQLQLLHQFTRLGLAVNHTEECTDQQRQQLQTKTPSAIQSRAVVKRPDRQTTAVGASTCRVRRDEQSAPTRSARHSDFIKRRTPIISP